MIEHNNPEADEAHDIVMKQRGYERLKADLRADAERLAMFPELVEALDFALTQLWQAGIKVDPIANTLPDRARAIK